METEPTRCGEICGDKYIYGEGSESGVGLRAGHLQVLEGRGFDLHESRFVITSVISHVSLSSMPAYGDGIMHFVVFDSAVQRKAIALSRWTPRPGHS